MKRSVIVFSSGMAAAMALATSASANPLGFPTIFYSGSLEHAVPRNIDGTTLNLVTAVFDDAGPLSGDWDINFWSDSGALAFDPFDEHDDELVVDANGEIAVLQPGDRIGPQSTFAHAPDAAPAWRSGVEGYLGVRFVCAGRGFFPGDEVCYGWIHVVSGADHGFPATIVDYAFETTGADIGIASPLAGCARKDTIFCNGMDGD